MRPWMITRFVDVPGSVDVCVMERAFETYRGPNEKNKKPTAGERPAARMRLGSAGR
jgi:hypothetical protein